MSFSVFDIAPVTPGYNGPGVEEKGSEGEKIGVTGRKDTCLIRDRVENLNYKGVHSPFVHRYTKKGESQDDFTVE